MKITMSTAAAAAFSLMFSVANAGCQTCGDHVICTADVQSGATWYKWLDFDTSLLTMADPQGVQEMTFNCKRVDESGVEANPYTASPSATPPGVRVGSEQAHYAVCASCPTCGPAD